MPYASGCGMCGSRREHLPDELFALDMIEIIFVVENRNTPLTLSEEIRARSMDTAQNVCAAQIEGVSEGRSCTGGALGDSYAPYCSCRSRVNT